MRLLIILVILTAFVFSNSLQAVESGLHLLISAPMGDMADVSKTGMGLGAKFFYTFEAQPWFGLRGDLAYLSYDSKQQLVNYGGYATYQTTRREGFQLTFGPQFRYTRDIFQAYLSPMVGFQYFQTVISLPDISYYYNVNASDTRDSFGVFGWSLSSGVLFDIGLGPWIDLGLKYNYLFDGVRKKLEEQSIKSDGYDLTVTLGVVFFREVQ